MTESPDSMRLFHLTRTTITNCDEGCDKPGVGSASHNPYDNNCDSDCAIVCCPCAFVIDIIMLVCTPLRYLYRKCHKSRNTKTPDVDTDAADDDVGADE